MRSLSMTAATPRTLPHWIDGDRDSAAAAADDDLAGVDELLDRRHLDDLSRQRRRHDAAELAAAFVADVASRRSCDGLRPVRP